MNEYFNDRMTEFVTNISEKIICNDENQSYLILSPTPFTIKALKK